MECGRTLQLDNSGDLLIDSKHRFSVISGTEKAVQDLTVRLKSVVGSLATDPSFATDIVGLIEAGDNENLQENIIRHSLQEYRYTKSVGDITITRGENRASVISAHVTLTDNQQVSIEAIL